MVDFTETLDRLCATSRRRSLDPYTEITWPARLDPEQWAFSPELISLFATDAWECMADDQRRRLSFFETVNFFSLNIHGEKSLVEGLARRVHQPGMEDVTPYLHHFLDEENKHMVYFGDFCQRYADKIYRDRKVAFPRDYAPGEEDFLFFVRVLIFEEIVDVYNVRMATDERLPAVVRRINLLHHQEESRHLAFGCLVVKRLFQRYASEWSPPTLAGIQEYLQSYVAATWREYSNPDVYRDAGLSDPLEAQRQALEHPACRAHRQEITERALAPIRKAGVLEEVDV
jgi:P-aminobenzoate N-oxygenase AurF